MEGIPLFSDPPQSPDFWGPSGPLSVPFLRCLIRSNTDDVSVEELGQGGGGGGGGGGGAAQRGVEVRAGTGRRDLKGDSIRAKTYQKVEY